MIVEDPKDQKEIKSLATDVKLFTADERTRMSNITDDIRFLSTTDTIPVDTPVRPMDRIRLYRSGQTSVLYVWEASTQTWLSFSTGDLSFSISSKADTYYTFQLPYYATTTNSSVDNEGSSWSTNNLADTVEWCGHSIRAISSASGLAYFYSQELPGVGSARDLSFSSGKKVVVSYRYKGNSSPEAFHGMGEYLPAGWYESEDPKSHRAGFGIGSGYVMAVTDNGTTATTTALTAITNADWNTYRIEFNPGVDVKFYVNGVLEATHTTTLPTANEIHVGSGHSANSVSWQMTAPIISIEL